MIEIENALEELKHCKDIGNIIFQVPEDNEIIDTIIQTLEKQIPKKVEKDKYIGIDGDFYDLCPTCKNNLCTTGLLARSKKRYCGDCGQRLDWGVEE